MATFGKKSRSSMIPQIYFCVCVCIYIQKSMSTDKMDDYQIVDLCKTMMKERQYRAVANFIQTSKRVYKLCKPMLRHGQIDDKWESLFGPDNIGEIENSNDNETIINTSAFNLTTDKVSTPPHAGLIMEIFGFIRDNIDPLATLSIISRKHKDDTIVIKFK